MDTTTATLAGSASMFLSLRPPIPAALGDGWHHWEGVELSDDRDALRCARRRVRELLNEWGLPALADDAAVVVSELVTNALRSPRESTGSTCSARLWLLAKPTSLAILVGDAKPTAPQRVKAGPNDEGGRGLEIVDALSSRWGWSPLPGQSGKVVWALFKAHPGTPLEIPMQEDGLFAFERTGLEKLRLACQVILDQAGEQFITDPLEAELYGLRDQIDRVLLLPGRPSAMA